MGFSFTNFAIFTLFFGIALIEALQKRNWLEAALFLGLGVLSLWADTRRRSGRRDEIPNP
jgi:hypothetical protein